MTDDEYKAAVSRSLLLGALGAHPRSRYGLELQRLLDAIREHREQQRAQQRQQGGGCGE